MVSILPSFFPCLSTGGRLPPHFSFCCSSSFSWPLRSLPSISGAIFAILPPFFGWGASSLFLLRSHLHFSSLFRGSSTVFLLPDDPLIRPFRILIHFSSACYSHSRLFPLCLSFLSVEFKKKIFIHSCRFRSPMGQLVLFSYFSLPACILASCAGCVFLSLFLRLGCICCVGNPVPGLSIR